MSNILKKIDKGLIILSFLIVSLVIYFIIKLGLYELKTFEEYNNNNKYYCSITIYDKKKNKIGKEWTYKIEEKNDSIIFINHKEKIKYYSKEDCRYECNN